MKLIDNQSEKAYRDNQTEFGHLGSGTDVEKWFHSEYYPGSIRERRYRTIIETYLAGTEALRVLEIAAGVGDFTMYCMKLFPLHAYHANELSEKQLSGNIGKIAKYLGLSILPELSFWSVEDGKYIENCFDIVFIKAAVHHFENPNKGFENIYRLLKPGGRVVFFEDPVCLDIPIYRTFIKKNFAKHERQLGINEHIYTAPEYLSFGRNFLRKEFYFDEVLVGEYDRHQKKRKGIKRLIGRIIRSWTFLFGGFMIWRFSPMIFVFTKSS